MNGLKTNIIEVSTETLKVELIFGPKYKYFKGHFESFPILPALIQLQKVIEFTEQYLGIACDNLILSKMKFKKPIRPNDNVFLEVSYNKNNGKLDFIFESKKGENSSGEIQLC